MSVNEGQSSSRQENTDNEYTQSHYREEHLNRRNYPVEEDNRQGPSYSSARGNPREADGHNHRIEQGPNASYNNEVDHSNDYDYDNDPQYQAFLRRRLEEENYHRNQREIEDSRNYRDERDNRAFQGNFLRN